MRKEVPLLITAIVGIVLILQYFSPWQQINSIEKIFNDWFQIVAAFSMILGVLNLIRVNGDKIYKKRKNWGYSVIIIISLFLMMFVGFVNISGEGMYDRKVLKSNTPVITNLATDLLRIEKITPSNPDYNPTLLALVEGMQEERTISSLIPKNLKDHRMKDRYPEFLKALRTKTDKIIVTVNQIGRILNGEFAQLTQKMQDKNFLKQFTAISSDLDGKMATLNKTLSVTNGKTVSETLKLQTKAMLLKSLNLPLLKGEDPYVSIYNDTMMSIRTLNEFILKDERVIAMLNSSLSDKSSYNDFYKKVAPKFALTTVTPMKKSVVDAILPVYLNNIYRMKSVTQLSLSNFVTKQLSKLLAEDPYIVDMISTKVQNAYIAYYQKNFTTYIKNSASLLSGNRYLKTEKAIETVYADLLPMLFTMDKKGAEGEMVAYLKSPLTLRKLKTSPVLLQEIAKAEQKVVTGEGFSDKIAMVVIPNLLSSGKYYVGTLDNGSVFMEMYRYVYSPLSSTMFALLAFFIASASYRAFRARNKEATLLLVAGFLVMLGRIPVGDALMEMLHLDGLISISGISQFIMDVPNMAAQRAIMIGIALGVISTSLRLITGIERSHLGGE